MPVIEDVPKYLMDNAENNYIPDIEMLYETIPNSKTQNNSIKSQLILKPEPDMREHHRNSSILGILKMDSLGCTVNANLQISTNSSKILIFYHNGFNWILETVAYLRGFSFSRDS